MNRYTQMDGWGKDQIGDEIDCSKNTFFSEAPCILQVIKSQDYEKEP